MNILYLTHTCPYPPNRGDRIRCYHILKHISTNHNLTLLYPTFDNHHITCQVHLQQYCQNVIPVKYCTFSSYLYCIRSIISNQPISVSFFYSKMLKRIIQRLSPDMVLVDCSTMAPYILDMPYPKILDFVDIDS